MIKVLYVEDEPFLSKIVKESLETRGFQVFLVEDGNKVIPAFNSWNPDICILDIMLPGKDGYSIGKEIRAGNAFMPIIYVTAKQQTADVVQGFESGGNDYMRKPFSIEELIVRMNNLLSLRKNNAPEIRPQEVFQIGTFSFDTIRQTLSHPEQERQISFREAELLRIFAQAPNTTINRKNILEQIWGHDSLFNSRNLDVYITRLRDYLKHDPQVQIITLKGVGYRLLV